MVFPGLFMNFRIKSSILTASIVFFLVGCVHDSQPNNNEPVGTNGQQVTAEIHRNGSGTRLSPGLFKLPSGRQITISNISDFVFPKSGPALVMHYQTNIRIEALGELREEVDEIWTLFKDDAERAKVSSVAIRAIHNESSAGIVRNGTGYGFIFLKSEDGIWHCLEDEKK